MKLLLNMICLIFFYWMNIPSASASIYILGSTSANPAELEAYRRIHPEHKFFTEILAVNLVPTHKQKKVMSLFLKAQKSFIEDPLPIAKGNWTAILPYLYSADWEKNEREVFVIALLRLAQIDPEQGQSYIKQAVEFYPGYTPPADIFPPNITTQWHRALENMNWTYLDKNIWKNYEVLLVNGEFFNLNSMNAIRIASGFQRLTFLSATHTTITKTISSAQIKTFMPTQSTWVTGGCESPHVVARAQNLLKNKIYHIVYNDCVWRSDAPIPADSVATSPPLIPFENNLTNHFPQQDKFYEKKLFWWGLAAVVATGLVIQNESENRQPTTKTGW